MAENQYLEYPGDGKSVGKVEDRAARDYVDPATGKSATGAQSDWVDEYWLIHNPE